MPEPTVSGAYGRGWETLKKHFPELLLIFLLQFLLSIPMSLGNYIYDPEIYGFTYTGFFNLVYGLVVILPVSYGANWVYIKAIRREAFRASDIFFAFQRFGNVVLSGILVGGVIGIGIVLLIVPGIIFACKLAFVPYLVMEQKMEAVEAVRKSWQMTTGYAGTIFLIGFLAIFVGLLGLLCLGVGIIPAAILISLAFASMYIAVSGKVAGE